MMHISDPSHVARKGDRPQWIERAARLGFVTKGVVYVTIGVLALQAALGTGGATEGSRGAIRELSEKPFGQVLLGIIAFGLFCYAVWRVLEAWLDPRREGGDTEGSAKRAGYFFSGVAYLALAAWAASILFGWSIGSGGRGGQGWTAWLMAKPFGLVLVAIAGVVVVGVGLYHFYEAYTAAFMQDYNTSRMDPRARMWAERLGRAGLAARGVVFCMIGFFLVQAALQSDPGEARGLGGALGSLAGQSYGPWLLGIVAAGLVAYGVYCFSRAKYCRFRV